MRPRHFLVKLTKLRSIFILSTDFTDSEYSSELVFTEIPPSPLTIGAGAIIIRVIAHGHKKSMYDTSNIHTSPRAKPPILSLKRLILLYLAIDST